MKIKNRNKLLSAGDIDARTKILNIIEKSLRELDAFSIIKDLLRLDGNVLRIGSRRWNLNEKNRIFVIGAGKACNSMAKAVEEKLGDCISEGLVIVKHVEPGDTLQRIELVAGGHPLPDENGFSASKRILNMVEKATADDLFISVISGGSSALMTCPVPGITLEDEVDVTEKLLKCGARIVEINAVRRHISVTNGGRLAQKIEAKGAEMINLVISDVVGDGQKAIPERTETFFGTPVAPDNTTLKDAVNVLEKYSLWSQTPQSVAEYLKAGSPAHETPKSFGKRISHFVVQKPADACAAAQRAAGEMGIPCSILTTQLEGESREAGTFLACVAKEVCLNHRPVQPPCVLISGGETTVKIEHTSGLGGPSQELVLGFAMEIENMPGLCIAAIDTDGTDGPTEYAGGIADSQTVKRAESKGVNVYEGLRTHDSSGILELLDDAVITGHTGTNLCDLNVIYIPENT